MDSATAMDTPPSAQAHAEPLAPAESVTATVPSLAPQASTSDDSSPLLAVTVAAASAGGLSAAAISCSHYVLSTLILHSPSTIDPAVIFRHVAGTTASSPAAHALVRRRYAALHLFLAWSVMQIGRLLRRRRIAKLPLGTPLQPPPWSLLVRTTAISWSSLELAQIVSMFAFYVLGPPTLASTIPTNPRKAVDIQSVIPSAAQCHPNSVSDDECCICLGSLVEPDIPTDIPHAHRATRSQFSSSTLTSESDNSETDSPTLGSLRPWIYHLLHTHITPDMAMDLDLDLDMDLLGEMIFPSSSSSSTFLPQTSPLQPQDRVMYTVCPTGKHPSHAACLQMYLQSQTTHPHYDANLGLRCPTCRTPIPTCRVPSSPISSDASEPTSSRSESTLQAALRSFRARVGTWLTLTRRRVVVFLRHALRACLIPSRWAHLVRAYALNWPRCGVFRGLVASVCSLFVLVHFRVHSRRRKVGSFASGSGAEAARA